MTNLIDESAYTRAIQPMNFASGEKQPGGHTWARQLVQNYVANTSQDYALKNLLIEISKQLEENRPVSANKALNEVFIHLREKGVL